MMEAGAHLPHFPTQHNEAKYTIRQDQLLTNPPTLLPRRVYLQRFLLVAAGR